TSLVAPVIYIADQDTYDVLELYMTSPTSPGASVKLNAPFVPGGYLSDYAVSPKGGAVFYTADQDTLNRYELYKVNIAAPGVATKLNAPLGVNRDVLDFVVSPDGTKVVYRADPLGDNLYELYLVDVAAPGVATKLNGPLVAGGWVRSNFEFSPDSTKVVYRADQDVVDTLELFVVDVAAPGVSKQVNQPLVFGGNVYTAYHFSPDGSRIVYIADQDADDVLELYAVSVSLPGVSSRLNGPLTAGGDVCRFELSPDSTRVAYCADQATDGVMELYTAAFATPGVSAKLNPPLVAGGKVTPEYAFGPDSSFVAYIAEQSAVGVADLYRADVATPGTAQQLNAPLVSGGKVLRFQIRPDGKHIGYIANQQTSGVYELFDVDFAIPGTSIKLSASMSATGLSWFEYTKDSSAAIYLAAQRSDAGEVFTVDLAAPGVAAQVSGSLVSGGAVWDFTQLP
ncbi:MAG: hypothetical protein ABI859_16205, partial [Pseudomonadota bacterium]